MSLMCQGLVSGHVMFYYQDSFDVMSSTRRRHRLIAKCLAWRRSIYSSEDVAYGIDDVDTRRPLHYITLNIYIALITERTQAHYKT